MEAGSLSENFTLTIGGRRKRAISAESSRRMNTIAQMMEIIMPREKPGAWYSSSTVWMPGSRWKAIMAPPTGVMPEGSPSSFSVQPSS